MSTEQTGNNPDIYKVQMHRWRMAFFGLVILLAGIVIGASTALIGKWHFMPAPGPGPDQIAQRMVEGLRRDLDLSPQQRGKIEPIIRRHMDTLDEIRRNARPLIDAQMSQMNEEVLPILEPRQRVLWDNMLRRLPIEPPGMQNPPGRGPRPDRPFDQQSPPPDRPAPPGPDGRL
jgi:hypothetical protein